MAETIKIEFTNDMSFFKTKKILESFNSIKIEAFSPIPFSNSKTSSFSWKNGLSIWGLIGSLIGAFLTGYFIYWTSVIDYRMNIGGKPLFSFVPSIPIIFEMSIFFAFVFIIIALLIKLKLPHWNEDDDDFAGRFILMIEFPDDVPTEDVVIVIKTSGGTILN